MPIVTQHSEKDNRTYKQLLEFLKNKPVPMKPRVHLW